MTVTSRQAIYLAGVTQAQKQKDGVQVVRIDDSMDWALLHDIAAEHGLRITYRVARCQHGKTRLQPCTLCENGYVDDTHTFANIGEVARRQGQLLVAISDDGVDVAYVAERLL